MKNKTKSFVLFIIYFIFIAISAAIISKGVTLLLKGGLKDLIGLPSLLIVLGLIFLGLSIQKFLNNLGIKSTTKT